MEVQKVPIGDLRYLKSNYREIPTTNMAGLKNSLKHFGQQLPLIVNKNTMEVVGGNQRLKAMKEMGWENVEVVFVDLDEKEADMLALALNNPGIQGQYSEKVNDLLENLRKSDLNLFDSLKLYDLAQKGKDLATGVTKGMIRGDHVIPEMELQPYEHYDYILILADNTHDWNWLCSFFEIERVRDPIKKQKIGLGRAIRAKKAIEKIQKGVDKSQRLSKED